MLKKSFIVFILSFCISQEIYTEYLVQDQDTIDVFSYQLPESYNELDSHPLLVAFHQWGGNENSTYYTEFDEEANSRGWVFMSPYGGSENNYNHQGAQEMVKLEILWMVENYNIDSNKIYMVGGSMGGASGMVYSNNHLNPNEPMVAATASGSGILDCERRAIEMDGNNSMIEWFGGNWDEVPFEYHRNSAIYFADSTQSMHYNLQHLPIYLDFGVSEPHRTHAEDMYNILTNYNQNMWIDTDPTGSHGFSVMDENHTCNWLSQFSLNDNPLDVNVKLDEPSRAYWLEALNQIESRDFITINAQKNNSALDIYDFQNSDSLVLYILDETLYQFSLSSEIPINKVGLTSDSILNENSIIENTEITSMIGTTPSYTIDNNIIWLEHYDLDSNELPFYGEFIINIEVTTSSNGDINQDGDCNIQDIILMINHIIDNQELSDIEQDIADMNNDGTIDIMDIISVINIITER